MSQTALPAPLPRTRPHEPAQGSHGLVPVCFLREVGSEAHSRTVRWFSCRRLRAFSLTQSCGEVAGAEGPQAFSRQRFVGNTGNEWGKPPISWRSPCNPSGWNRGGWRGAGCHNHLSRSAPGWQNGLCLGALTLWGLGRGPQTWSQERRWPWEGKPARQILLSATGWR